jgi:hypothetical protein
MKLRDKLTGVRALWRASFRHERAIFISVREQGDFLPVAGSKSSLFLGAEPAARSR